MPFLGSSLQFYESESGMVRFLIHDIKGQKEEKLKVRYVL